MKMNSRWHAPVCSIAFLIGSISAPRGATVTIDIDNLAFIPSNQTINAGDTVMWTNNDSTAHTSTSGRPGARDDLWNSGTLSPGQSFSHAFASAGTFPYYCEFHSMIGTITVQGAQGASPVVAITSPVNNTSLPGETNITLTADASEAGGTIAQVEFFDGSKSLGTDASNPYSISAELAAGTHSLTAKATDSNGASTTSAAVKVTVAGGGGGTKIEDPIPPKLQKGDITVDLQMIADGFTSPIGTAAPDDGSGRLFVYDQTGFIYIISTNGAKMAAPLLDVSGRLVPLDKKYDERGLVGVATHPDFAQHPFIYTYTSEPNGPMADFMIMTEAGKTNDHQSVIAEWRIDPNDSNRVDRSSRREILRVDKPQSNHNGGTMRFGPDGFLYFTIGDGGNADDQGDGHSPGGNAQDKNKILGKVSRIDVDARTSPNGQYGIPSDNPFAGQAGVVHEIFAYGLRNPYSFSFDRTTGDLFLADVGQNDVEEVDIIKKGGNFGWPIKEGTFFFDPNGDDAGFVTTAPVREVPSDLIDPAGEFDHDEGEAIIGGYAYRGSAIPSLSGKYVTAIWGDFAAANGRLLYLDGPQLKEIRIGLDDHGLGMWVKGFGEDQKGELYVFGSIDLGPDGTSGVMLKMVPAGSAARSTNSYLQKNLVSDLPDLAPVTDTNLVNPWGLAFGSSTPFWVSDNHAGVATVYDSAGEVQPLVVAIPPAAPTGIVFNDTTGFDVGGTPAKFIFATEAGTIAAWNGGAEAVLKVDNSESEAIYKGLTLANDRGSNFLYAADFRGGKIDVFDSNFQPVTSSGSFSDPTIAAGFAPFNIRGFGGNLYVTYAMQDEDKEDDVPGVGNGYINIFDPAGKFVKRFASNGALNSPWGLAVAPPDFGAFSGTLLVGNFGDGRINAFNPATGDFLGQLKNPNGILIWAEGLWDLAFGNGTKAGETNKVYFTAGISGGGELESHGLFGSVFASNLATNSFVLSISRNGNSLTINLSGGTGPFVLQKKTSLSDAGWIDVKTFPENSAVVTPEGSAAFFRVRANAL